MQDELAGTLMEVLWKSHLGSHCITWSQYQNWEILVSVVQIMSVTVNRLISTDVAIDVLKCNIIVYTVVKNKHVYNIETDYNMNQQVFFV